MAAASSDAITTTTNTTTGTTTGTADHTLTADYTFPHPRPFLPDQSMLQKYQKHIVGAVKLRFLDEFDDQCEVLQAMHDSIFVHREAFLASHTIHARLTPRTIIIPTYTPSGTSTPTQHGTTTASATEARAYLSSPTGANTAQPLDPAVRFMSVNTLSGAVLGRARSTVFEVDYSDDLESYWYVLAGVLLGSLGGGVRGSQSFWGRARSVREGALEKEAVLLGEGFSLYAFPQSATGVLYTPVFERVLDEMHVLVKYRHLQRLELARPRTIHEQLEDAEGDYEMFLCILKKGIKWVKMMGHHTMRGKTMEELDSAMAQSKLEDWEKRLRRMQAEMDGYEYEEDEEEVGGESSDSGTDTSYSPPSSADSWGSGSSSSSHGPIVLEQGD